MLHCAMVSCQRFGASHAIQMYPGIPTSWLRENVRGPGMWLAIGELQELQEVQGLEIWKSA